MSVTNLDSIFTVEKDMELTEEFIGLHAINPFIGNNSSARSYMLSNHISQIVALENGDEKIIQTGLEKQFGDNTFSKKLENDSRILSIISRYNGVDINHASETTELTVVYEDLVTGEIGILDIPQAFKLHQYFGFKYRWNTDILNNITVNTVLPAGTVLADSPTVTNNKGYKFGVNANLAYLSIPEVTEDGVVISKTMAKKLAYKTYETRVVEFGENSFPLNIYGDENTYKPFPDIGEPICDDGVLMVLREYDNDLAPALISRNDVREFDPAFDRAEYVKPKNSKIVDIKVWYNPKHKKSVYTGTTEGVDKYVNGLKKYYKELITVYEKLVDDHYRKFKNRDLKITEKFHRKLMDAYTIVNAKENKVKFTHRNDKLDIYRIEFIIEHSVDEVVKGAKISTAHGSKGVVVEVRDDKDMPKDHYGNPVDIIMDPTSIPGRMNIGNLYEQYFNSVSRHTKYLIINKMKELNEELITMTDTTVDELFNIVLGLLKIIDTEQFVGYSQATTHQKREILKEILEEELYIYYKVSSKKKPYQIVLEIKGTIYEPYNFPINIGKDGKLMITKKSIMVGPQYVILLAKTPENFLSTASAKTNHYGLPVGVSAKTRNRLPWKNSPVKILSETETRLYASYVGRKGLAELKDRANSIPTHSAIYRNILEAKTPTNIDVVVDRRKVPFGNDSAIQFIDNIVNAAGMEIDYVKDTRKDHPVIK